MVERLNKKHTFEGRATRWGYLKIQFFDIIFKKCFVKRKEEE